jgi:uncharacterized repeat protein (TIGR03803 family)
MKDKLQFLQDFSGRLRMIALALLVLSLAVCAQAQTFTTLESFTGSNGSVPFFGSMVQATNGNYFGSTHYGGTKGYGVIFQMTSAGKLTDLYSFCSLAACADGEYPVVAPILGSDGNFYGTTTMGGNSTYSGTVYKITTGGKLTTLYSFCPRQFCSDGEYPMGLIQASNGNFYGVAEKGGKYKYGTLFQVGTAGQFRLLYTFCAQQGCVDGATPEASPMQASDGNFYGTASSGGSHGQGVVYEITPAGSYTVLYNFCSQPGCADGAGPEASLVQDANGHLYGTTIIGGSFGNGTVFEITPSNQYSVLHSFDYTDGADPQAAPTLANDGNLYGVTTVGSNGGNSKDNGGNIFQITPGGVYKSLYSFCNSATCTGYDPAFALLQGTDGIFYGAAASGGKDSDGIVYSFSNNLSPLVETVPVAGKVGQSTIILGNGLTGSTSVTFNGVAAAFTVESDTYIKATVPPGATTGTVQVITPTQTLNSNPVFRVTK